jgi:hypothetical protein
MQTETTSESTVEVRAAKKPFVCPTDPAELEQCDSCQ